MPIRINFLAEEQAVEELRRRDPVKRAVLGGVGLVGAVIIYLIVLVVLGFSDKGQLEKQKTEWENMKKDVEAVEADEKKTKEIEGNLMALSQLATNRFAWGPVLNALQQTMAEHVSVMRFAGEQSYVVFIPPPPAKGSKEKPKPATSTQKITLRIRAQDTGERADRSYANFQKNIASHPYFSENLIKPNGVRFSQPPTVAVNPRDNTKQVVSFELECVYPEVVR